MINRKASLLFGFCTLVLAVMSCMINLGGPAFPSATIPVSTDAVDELQSTLAAAVSASSSSGEISLSITESQLTSYLASQLQAQSQPILSNIQAYLQDGQIQLYGTVQKGYFEANAGAILTAGVDDQGQLKIDLTSADFGPLPIPAGFLDVITTAIKEAYTSALGPVATGFRLDGITITNGTMTITGRIK
jgi:hypothetical protein